MKTEGLPIEVLVDFGECVSVLVAELLLECERRWRAGNETEGLSDSVVKAFIDEMQEPERERVNAILLEMPFVRDDDKLTHCHDDDFLQRAAQLVVCDWHSVVRKRIDLRPDVLSLTCRLLTNPSETSTYAIARYAVVLNLRSLYKITYTNQHLEGLLSAYKRLQERFDRPIPRQCRPADEFESILLDIVMLDQWAHRSLTGNNLTAYYNAFREHPFGVKGRLQMFANEQDWLTIQGQLPEFPACLNTLFAHPLGVPGLDEVMIGGLLASVGGKGDPAQGGSVTLVAGPPGSGKTSLCLTIASLLDEFGSVVAYLAEEGPDVLIAKLTALGGKTLGDLWPYLKLPPRSTDERFPFVPSSAFSDLQKVMSELELEFKASRTAVAQCDSDADSDVWPLFNALPRVVIIDSASSIPMNNGVRSRQHLATSLETLRMNGYCVFLISDISDVKDKATDLAYLVDNVITIDVEQHEGWRHPVRLLTIHKTRLQISHRGEHVFHLSQRTGCTVSPSLHAVLRELKSRPPILSNPLRRAVLWSGTKQISPPGMPPVDPLTVRDRSQVLLYGFGPAAKARLGLSMLLERRDPVKTEHNLERSITRGEASSSEALNPLGSTRLLVISFLFGADYYRAIAQDFLQKRHRLDKTDAEDRVTNHVSIRPFHPGYVDPETLIMSVRNEIWGASLLGRPYSSVLVDGIQNLLLQFPLLSKETLLWPTLYRLFRIEGLNAVSTFTFFRVADSKVASLQSMGLRGMRSEVEDLFCHLLVSSCDYTFVVERPGDPLQEQSGDCIQVSTTFSVDGYKLEPVPIWWNPETFQFSLSQKQI